MLFINLLNSLLFFPPVDIFPDTRHVAAHKLHAATRTFLVQLRAQPREREALLYTDKGNALKPTIRKVIASFEYRRRLHVWVLVVRNLISAQE
jgi:hypothetical protein